MYKLGFGPFGDLGSSNNTVHKLIWKNIAPHKTQCFGWLVIKGRVKTGEYLHKLGIIQSVDNAHCKFCNAYVLLLIQQLWLGTKTENDLGIGIVSPLD